MSQVSLLLLSSDPSLIESCQGVIASIADLRLVVQPPGEEVDSYLERAEIALVLIHVTGERDAKQAGRVLRAIALMQQPIAVVVLGERHDPAQVLSFLRQGAADFLSRPLDLSRLAYLIDTLTVRARYARTRPDPIAQLSNEIALDLRSAAMGPLVEQIHRVAPQDTTLLLGGETGTGKTRLARLIHELSPRREQPFVVVNCAALAASLMESEMFGHVKGAFTGADRDRVGKFAAAGRGTLLLDDVDSLPLTLQAKLLRVVEERTFEPVGSNRSVPVEARLIAASNRALEQEVEVGRFRTDLYYRLNVIAFYLPPLRERPSAIPNLVAGFLAEIAARNGHPLRGISADALRALESYGWPGNIRELRNVIERTVAFCPGDRIQLSNLPESICSEGWNPSSAGSSPVQEPVDSTAVSVLGHAKGELEAAHIAAALRKHGNNRFRAAAELGISRMTLYRKLHKYGLINAV
jgi:two-component system response regulator HydG